jgi:hypothetical protein
MRTHMLLRFDKSRRYAEGFYDTYTHMCVCARTHTHTCSSALLNHNRLTNDVGTNTHTSTHILISIVKLQPFAI